MITMLDGMCVSLDSHLTDLLDIYTRERNQFVREGLAGEFELPPTATTMEDVAREMIRKCILEWLEKRAGHVRPTAPPPPPHVPETAPPPLAVTYKEAGQLLGGLSVRHIERMVIARKLRSSGAHRARRIVYASITAYLERA